MPKRGSAEYSEEIASFCEPLMRLIHHKAAYLLEEDSEDNLLLEVLSDLCISITGNALLSCMSPITPEKALLEMAKSTEDKMAKFFQAVIPNFLSQRAPIQ